MAITLTTEVMIGVIVGSVFGGIVLLLFFGCIVYFACCRHRRKNGSAPAVIREHRNGHGNPLYAAPPHPVKFPDRRSDPAIADHMEAGKAIGYAYPIRPVSAAHPSTTSNHSSSGTKSSTPVKRTPSQLPPNAFRLPGLADKHFSMSDSNLSSVGRLNPAYDASDDVEINRPVYRAQSLMQVSQPPDQHSMQAAYKLRTSSMDARPMSKVYHYDGSLGRVTTLDEHESSHGSRGRHSAHPSEDTGSGFQVRQARELQPPRESDEGPPDFRRRTAPAGPPPRLPRVPLTSKAPQESGAVPASPRRKSLTSELSYRAKGHIVTSEAFNFLDAFSDDPPKS